MGAGGSGPTVWAWGLALGHVGAQPPSLLRPHVFGGQTGPENDGGCFGRLLLRELPRPLEVCIIPFPHFCDAQMQLAFPSSPTQSPSILLSCARPPASLLDPAGRTANPTALAGGSSARTGMLPPASRPCGLGAGVIPPVRSSLLPCACASSCFPRGLLRPLCARAVDTCLLHCPKRPVLSSSPSSAPGLPRAVCVTSGKSTNGSPPSTSVPGPLFLLPPLQRLPAHPESPLSLGSSMARVPGFPPPDCLVWITDVDAHLFLCRESCQVDFSARHADP